MLYEKSQFLYQPLFCEENIWNLVRSLEHKRPDDESFLDSSTVLFFINASRSVGMFHQLAFPEECMGCWDYHVVLFLQTEKVVLDFDSRLGFRVDVKEYFELSFPGKKPLENGSRIDYEAVVRKIAAKDYLVSFSSDRSHMLDESGKPLAEFPAWEPIQSKENPLPLGHLTDVAFTDSRITDETVNDFLLRAP